MNWSETNIKDKKLEVQLRNISFNHSWINWIFYLQNTCLNDTNVNFVQFLQEIASEQQFEVTYVDIEEKTYCGQYQCLVQLSTLPVAVCQGYDISFLLLNFIHDIFRFERHFTENMILFLFRFWENIKSCSNMCCTKCTRILENNDKNIKKMHLTTINTNKTLCLYPLSIEL